MKRWVCDAAGCGAWHDFPDGTPAAICKCGGPMRPVRDYSGLPTANVAGGPGLAGKVDRAEAGPRVVNSNFQGQSDPGPGLERRVMLLDLATDELVSPTGQRWRRRMGDTEAVVDSETWDALQRIKRREGETLAQAIDRLRRHNETVDAVEEAERRQAEHEAERERLYQDRAMGDRARACAEVLSNGCGVSRELAVCLVGASDLCDEGNLADAEKTSAVAKLPPLQRGPRIVGPDGWEP